MEGLDPRHFAHAATELRHQFTKLLESLSAFRTLVEVDVRVESETDFLYRALDALADHHDLERCSIFLLEGDNLVNRAGFNRATGLDQRPSQEPAQQGHTYNATTGLMGETLRTGELQHADNCAFDERFVQMGSEPPPGTLIGVPIQHGGEALGVLNVSHSQPGAFEPWHEHLLHVFGTVLGQMLTNHRLVNRMDAQVRHRTDQLERSLEETQELKNQFEELSTTDDLTGLKNRRHFFPAAASELSRATRHGTPLSLLLIDLDHFKEVNDRFGHASGDRVLNDLAGFFRSQVREEDLVARMGGEEFIIAIPETGIEGARTLAYRIGEAVRGFQWEHEDGETFGVTLSIGLTSLDDGTPRRGDAQRLLDRMISEADMALYHCKANGRDQVAAFTDPETAADS